MGVALSGGVGTVPITSVPATRISEVSRVPNGWEPVAPLVPHLSPLILQLRALGPQCGEVGLHREGLSERGGEASARAASTACEQHELDRCLPQYLGGAQLVWGLGMGVRVGREVWEAVCDPFPFSPCRGRGLLHPAGSIRK